MQKIISILTDWGKDLGQGHIQRMLNLHSFLNNQDDIKSYIINSDKPEFIKNDYSFKFLNEPHPDSNLIIRDMRDSTEEEIKHLKKISKILVVDDNGPGREEADFKIDLLPNPLKKKLNPDEYKELYLYGYNFVNSLQDVDDYIDKNIDFTIYTGNVQSEKYIKTITSILPENSSIVFLANKDSIIIKDRKKFKLKNFSYSKILLSSKAIITHFGITLYEAFICGCKLITLNPTKYHSTLSDMVMNEMNILNLGVYDLLEKESAKRMILEHLKNNNIERVLTLDVYKETQRCLENFYNFIKEM